jgi:hypothetical protein
MTFRPRKFHVPCFILLFLAGGDLRAGQAPAPDLEAQCRKWEERLQPVPVRRGERFPWAGVKRLPPKTVEASSEGAPDFSMDEAVLEADGPLRRTLLSKSGAAPQEVLEVRKNVRLTQPRSGAFLCAQRLRVVRDAAGGEAVKVEAEGAVESVTGDRRLAGETLVYESVVDNRGRLVRHTLLLQGDAARAKRARWRIGNDLLEAARVELDLRRNLLSAQGEPWARVTPEGGAKRTGASPSVGPLPGMALEGGQPVLLSCGGEMTFDGASGRLALRRGVTLWQDELAIQADELTLDLEPRTQAGGPRRTGDPAALGGQLQSAECRGRVELSSGNRLVLCDRMVYDLGRQELRLEMNDAAALLKIYTLKEPFLERRAEQVLSVAGRLKANLLTGEVLDFEEAGRKPAPFRVATLKPPLLLAPVRPPRPKPAP